MGFFALMAARLRQRGQHLLDPRVLADFGTDDLQSAKAAVIMMTKIAAGESGLTASP
jgi:hypothetical protein